MSAIALFLAVLTGAGMPETKLSVADEARLVLRKYAACLVKSRRPDRMRTIDAFLAVSPRDRRANELVSKGLNEPNCLSVGDPFRSVSQLRMDSQLLRGELFRARYLNQFPGKAVTSFKPFDVAADWHFQLDDEFAPLQAIGECVVRVKPVEARAAITAEVGSTAEDAAYATVIPALQECMPSGGTYRFSRAVLEGLFAESLYRLSVGADTAPAPEHN